LATVQSLLKAYGIYRILIIHPGKPCNKSTSSADSVISHDTTNNLIEAICKFVFNVMFWQVNMHSCGHHYGIKHCLSVLFRNSFEIHIDSYPSHPKSSKYLVRCLEPFKAEPQEMFRGSNMFKHLKRLFGCLQGYVAFLSGTSGPRLH